MSAAQDVIRKSVDGRTAGMMNISTPLTPRRVALLAFSVALASSSTTLNAQTTTQTSKLATYICRPAQPDETATATMASGAMKLECRPFAVNMRMSDGSMKTIGNTTVKPQPGPDLSHALTAQQIQEACVAWLYQVLKIEPATVHTP